MATRTYTLTDDAGETTRYTITNLGTGWRVLADDVDVIVPNAAVGFATASNVVNAAYASLA